MVKSLRKKSGKKSRKSKLSKLRRSKSHHCKHKYLKTPVKDKKTGRMRYCKKRRYQKYGGNKGELRRSAKKDYKKSRKSSLKSSRKRKCKHGELKNPVRLSSGRMRYCKLKKKSAKKKSKSKRKSSRKSSRKRKCKHGMLKTPVRLSSGRMRYCKLKKKSRKKSTKKSKKKSAKKSKAKKSKAKKSKKKSAKKSKAKKSAKKSKAKKKSQAKKSAKKSKAKAKAKKKSAKDLGCIDICLSADRSIPDSIRKKYCNRNSPPYPASACLEGDLVSGNDGETYEVKKNKRGVQTWRKHKGHPGTPLTLGGEVELARAQERRRLRRGRADESSDDESDDERDRDVFDAEGNLILARSSQGR